MSLIRSFHPCLAEFDKIIGLCNKSLKMFKKKTRFRETNCLLDLVFRNWERGNFLRTSFNISLPGRKDSRVSQVLDHGKLKMSNENFSF